MRELHDGGGDDAQHRPPTAIDIVGLVIDRDDCGAAAHLAAV